jgi:hypothetical protein
MENTQTIRANSDPRYYLRFLLMGIVALGFCLWSLYDGLKGYPDQQERALAFEKLEDDGREDEWEALALEKGWPTGAPGEPKGAEEFDADVKMQFVMAVLAGTVAVPLLIVPLRSRGRWIEASETGLASSWGQRADYDSVIALDKKLWRKKGIAKVRYQDGRRKRRFVLDNYKFQRDATDYILYELESRIDPEKIVGGPPEPPLDEYAEEPAEPVSEPSNDPS